MEKMMIHLADVRSGEDDYGFDGYLSQWFDCPVNFEEVKEKLMVDNEEQIVIEDYRLPFEIDEDTSIYEVNRLCEMLMDLPQYIKDEFSVLLEHFDNNVEYLCENHSCIKRYSDCETIADVMSLYRLGDGTYIETGHGIYEIDH